MPPSNKFIIACFLAELFGTFLLVLMGDGAIAAFIVKREKVDLFTVCFGFGCGAMIATFISGNVSGAHLNPAASLAQALAGDLKWSMLAIYMAAQYLGGFLAALVLFLNYAEAINSVDGGTRSAFGNANTSTGSIFATYPGEWVTVWGSLLDQIVGTAVLVFSLSAVTDQKNLGPEKRANPLYIALVICSSCVAFSPNCGAIFNPARDLAPRLLTFIVGYSNPSVWSPIDNLYWITAGLIGPHVGAIVGLFSYRGLSSLWHSCAPPDYPVERYNNTLNRNTEQGQDNSQQQRTSDFGAKSFPENISYGGNAH